MLLICLVMLGELIIAGGFRNWIHISVCTHSKQVMKWIFKTQKDNELLCQVTD